LQINLHPSEALVFRHRPHPTDPQRSRFDQVLLRRGPATRSAPRLVRSDDPVIGPVTAADLAIAERLQLGVRSLGFPGPRYTRHDGLVAHFAAQVDALVDPR